MLAALPVLSRLLPALVGALPVAAETGSQRGVPAVAHPSVPAAPAASTAPIAPAPATDSADLRPLPPTRIYLGMWSVHLRDLAPEPMSNRLVAASYRGFFGGTFVNSFGDRAVAAGLQRAVWEHGRGGVGGSVGYRVGLVTGYDDRLLGIGHLSPVIPFLQVLANVDWGPVGAELSWSGIVVSLAANVRPGRRRARTPGSATPRTASDGGPGACRTTRSTPRR